MRLSRGYSDQYACWGWLMLVCCARWHGPTGAYIERFEVVKCPVSCKKSGEKQFRSDIEKMIRGELAVRK